MNYIEEEQIYKKESSLVDAALKWPECAIYIHSGLMKSLTRILVQVVEAFDNFWDAKKKKKNIYQGTVLALYIPPNLQEKSQYFIALGLDWNDKWFSSQGCLGWALSFVTVEKRKAILSGEMWTA